MNMKKEIVDFIWTRCETKLQEEGFLPDYPQLSGGLQRKVLLGMLATVVGVLMLSQNGLRIVESSWSMYKPYLVGMRRNSLLIESTTVKGMLKEIYDLLTRKFKIEIKEPITLLSTKGKNFALRTFIQSIVVDTLEFLLSLEKSTKEKHQNKLLKNRSTVGVRTRKEKVYDLINVSNGNKYTISNDMEEEYVVSNCALAVNYGASKFSVSMSLFGDWKEQHLSEADRLIGLYKKGYQAYFRFNENCKRLRSSPTIYKDIGFRYIINPNSAGNFFIQGACARVLMHAVPRISCRKAIDRGIEFIYSLHDEVGLLVKDDENYTSNIAYITKSLQEAFMVAGLNNRHGLTINGKPYCADDVRVEVDEFSPGDIVYTKDRDTMKEILSLCEKIS